MQMEQAMQNNGPPNQRSGRPFGGSAGPHAGGPIRPPGAPIGNRSLINETPLPEKPTSAEICKFGIGCANKRCPYSHPSPVATESTGMVLRTESCPDGRGCKDADCPYSHISPAQVNGKSLIGMSSGYTLTLQTMIPQRLLAPQKCSADSLRALIPPVNSVTKTPMATQFPLPLPVNTPLRPTWRWTSRKTAANRSRLILRPPTAPLQNQCPANR